MTGEAGWTDRGMEGGMEAKMVDSLMKIQRKNFFEGKVDQRVRKNKKIYAITSRMAIILGQVSQMTLTLCTNVKLKFKLLSQYFFTKLHYI